MKNRISLDIDPKDVADFKTAQELQNNLLLKWLKPIDIKEIGAGNHMGTEGGWNYCQNGYKYCVQFPKLYDDEELDMAEYKKDIDTATFMVEAKKESDKTTLRVNALFNAVGKDLMEQTHYVRKRANEKVDKNSDYEAVCADLNTLFEKRMEKAEETRKINEQIKALQEQLAVAKKTA